MRIVREVVRHPLASLRCLQLRLDGFGGALHRHGHAELTWVERGSGLRWVGDSVEPFGDGDLVLVGADLPHLWVTPGPVMPGGCAATVMQFPVDWPAARQLPELARVEPLLARAAGGLAVEGATRSAVQAVLARLSADDALSQVASFIEVLALLSRPQAVLRPLSHAPAAPREATAVAAGRRQRVDRLLGWVQAHLAEELRAGDAAAIAGVSPAAFARFFRREVGKGFVEFVNDARCSWAALRLIQGDEPVAQIAQACGFSTLSHFGEQFRARHGVSPRAFRQAGRGGVRR